MKEENILIFGATAALVQETIRCFARDHAHLILVARNEEKLNAIKNDLQTRWDCLVTVCVRDFCGKDHSQDIMESVLKDVSHIDVVLIAHGILLSQEDLQKDFTKVHQLMQVNFMSVVSILMVFSSYMQKRQEGTLAVISSVAGDRGRQKNYVYGASKAALTVYLEGLRSRLHKSHVNVLTIKPGIIDTPMTAHMRKGKLCGDAQVVGQDIFDAIRHKKDILYTPWYWNYIMKIIKCIPTFIIKRTNF